MCLCLFCDEIHSGVNKYYLYAVIGWLLLLQSPLQQQVLLFITFIKTASDITATLAVTVTTIHITIYTVTCTTGRGISTTEAIIVILLLMLSPTTITTPLSLFLHIRKIQPLFTERLKVVSWSYTTRIKILHYK